MSVSALNSLDEVFAVLAPRTAQQGGIPSFSQSARGILAALSDDEGDPIALTQLVLADASLAQKVLRLANSAMYAVFGGEVSTVSRAIQVLGLQTVAHLALGQKVIEALMVGQPGNKATLDEMHKAMLAGYLGRQLASNASVLEAEEAAVCAILHNLGRMLVAFYLPEYWAQIQALMAQGASEAHACSGVLGAQLEEVGTRMAEQWGLPQSLTKALKSVEPADAQVAPSHEQWLCLLATAATRGAHILHRGGPEVEAELTGLTTRYAQSLGLEPEAMLGAIQAAQATAEERYGANANPATVVLSGKEREARLLKGLAELREAAKAAAIPQLMAEAVEFLQSALGASRGYAFLRFAKDARYKARFGLGEGAALLMPNLQLGDKFQPDVFHAALSREKPLFIENTRADNMKGKLPLWWLQNLGTAQSFCTIPLHLKGAPVGFLYFDWAPPTPTPRLDATVLHMLAQVREVLVSNVSTPRKPVAPD